jgi:hypothetical protein
VTWTNINQIAVSFDRAITGTMPTLSVVAASGATLAGSNPVLVQAATNTWRWTLPNTLPAGKFLVLVDGVAVAGGASSLTLSGASARSVSGGGSLTGTSEVAFTVLPGDANRNSSVTTADVTAKSRQVGARVTASNFRLDVNGSNSITTADVTVANRNVGQTASRMPAPVRPGSTSQQTTTATTLTIDPVLAAAWASFGTADDVDRKRT